MLTHLSDSLWTLAIDHPFFGLQYGARLTIARLEDGTLWVHSPTPLTPELKASVDELGPVAQIVAPNLFHHLYLGDWKAAYPDAKLLGVPGLEKKRGDLTFEGDAWQTSWKEIDVVPIEGTPRLRETAFIHKPSGTLIVSDLIQNLPRSDHLFTRTVCALEGINGKPGVSLLLRFAFGDKPAARKSLDALLSRDDWSSLFMAHGEPLTDNARETLQRSYAWL